MNMIVKILLESTIILSVFYIIYLLFQTNDKNFRFTRIYLIGSSFLAILLPQLNFPILSGGTLNDPIPIVIHDAIQLPEIIISNSDALHNSVGLDLSAGNILLILYLMGFIFFLGKFLYEMFQLLIFVYRNSDRVEKRSFYKLIPTGGRIPTSSFFNYLFWDDTVKLTLKEKEQIIRHEEGHISQYHSFDILYLELLRIIFWFNPFIHGYRKAIASVHEYLADDYAMAQNFDPQYLGLLARQILRSSNLSLNNHFSKSQTLKRIRMIKSDHRRSPLLHWSISLVIAGIMFYFFACETDASLGNINTGADKFPVIENVQIITPAEISPASYRRTVSEWIEKNADKSFVILSSPSPQISMNSIYSVGDWVIPSHYIDENEGSSMLYAIASYEPGFRLNKPEQEEIFTQADTPPTPQDGIDSFFQFVMKNLRYPEEARMKGIEGKVFVEFVVTESGSVDQVKVIRGLHPACDAEAMKVISESPDWIPGYKDGKPVNVKMVLPLTFALN
jgi:TonB family protein